METWAGVYLVVPGSESPWIPVFTGMTTFEPEDTTRIVIPEESGIQEGPT